MSKTVLTGLILMMLGVSYPLVAQSSLTPYEQGIVFWKKGDIDKAIKAFSDEVVRNPNALPAYYNLALVYEDVGQVLEKAGRHAESQDGYFNAYRTWRDYLELEPNELWAERANNHIHRLKRVINFEGPIFKEAKIEDIFPSIKNSYPFDPLGYVVVENRGAEAVRNLKVFLEAKKYMDFPTETEEIEILEIGDSARLELHATLNDQIMEVTGNTQFQMSLKASYHDGTKRVETQPKSYTLTLYNRNAMTWAPSDKLASFVTFIDPTVKLFAGNIIQMYRDEEVSFINERILKAMRLFQTLGAYGMTYVEDPQAPFRFTSENPEAIDYVQFPLDTIHRRIGDCDDGVVLYSAMLESVGIPTALVDFPGHVYPMFDTGVPVEKAHKITGDLDLIIPYKGTVWIPVETTLWRKTFTDVWRNAAFRFYNTPPSEKKIIEMSQAWKKYQPAPISGRGLDLEVPSKSEIDGLLAEDFVRQHEEKVDFIVKNNPRLVNATDDDYKSHNRLGAIYGRSMLYDESISEFKKALKANPDYLEARINLGYVYYLRRDYDEAIEEFSRIDSEKVRPAGRRARIHFNLGMAYYRQGDRDRAEEEWETATRLDSSYKARSESVVLKVGGEKASEGESALPEMDILWEE